MAVGLHGSPRAMRPTRLRRRRDGGFSLLVVFVLIIAMVGVAATVILSTQQDLSVAGQERESLQAFYAAEYAVAQAKDFLAGAAAVGGWTPVLAQINAAGATQGCATGPINATPRMAWSDLGGNVRWRWCIHNNADDLAYLDPGGSAPPGCVGKTGDVCDERDPLHLVTIEAWSLAGAAQSHLVVNVGNVALHASTWYER
jgi:type II secretory pathway pseudopilin PulG